MIVHAHIIYTCNHWLAFLICKGQEKDKDGTKKGMEIF